MRLQVVALTLALAVVIPSTLATGRSHGSYSSGAHANAAWG